MNRTVLVTGGCGFIGSHLVEALLSRGINVVNIDKVTYAADKDMTDQRASLFSSNYSHYEVDVVDKASIASILQKYQPDKIFHLAAESHVDNSISGSEPFILTNIVGTHSLLEASREYQVIANIENFCFVHVSTDEVYGALNDIGYFTERSNYLPNSPYSASKASSDLLCHAWFKTYNFPVIVTNCSNNYGPYQFAEKLIPKTVLSCIKKTHISLYGNGKNIRDWLYVKDHCDALINISENGKIGDKYNIGGNCEITNFDLILQICQIARDEIDTEFDYTQLIRFTKDRLGHDFRYAIDNSKICNELDWHPKVAFKDGLVETVIWNIQNLKFLEQNSDGFN